MKSLIIKKKLFTKIFFTYCAVSDGYSVTPKIIKSVDGCLILPCRHDEMCVQKAK
jgi:hypothetical protein